MELTRSSGLGSKQARAPAGALRRWGRPVCRMVELVFLAALVLSGCRSQEPPAPSPTVGQEIELQTNTPPVTSSLPTPGPYLPTLAYVLSPRAQLVHVQTADTDDDGVQETIALYRDSSSPGASIRGFVAEHPTPATPTPVPAADERLLAEVYWLGPGEAIELFRGSWDILTVEDINGDGASEILIQGLWEEGTPAVHVFRWDGTGYRSLLSLRTRGSVRLERDEDGKVAFATEDLSLARSGIVQRELTAWHTDRYVTRRQVSWQSDPPQAAPYPEAALLHYYETLGAGDFDEARRWWTPDLQQALSAPHLQERAEWFVALQLDAIRLLDETGEDALAAVELSWNDPASGDRVTSANEQWALERTAEGWRLSQLNGSPREAEWHALALPDPLAESHVTDIMEDDQGRLWIATAGAGLAVWDGSYWSEIRARTDGLASDEVRDLALNREGALWFATADGVTRYDGQRWDTYGPADGLPSERANSLAVGPEGQVWTATDLGLSAWDGERWRPLSLPVSDGATRASAVTVASTGELWVGLAPVEPGLNGPLVGRLDDSGWTLFGREDGLVGSGAARLAFDAQGQLWVALAGDANEPGGVSTWTGSEWATQTTLDTLSDVSVYWIAFDDTGAAWVGTSRGVAIGSGPDHSTWEVPQELAGRAVPTILAASDGLLYLGTRGALMEHRPARPLQVIGGGR